MTSATTATKPANISLESLREGQQAHFEFSVSEDEMARYAELSGDYNPLHCDTEFARSAGFEGRVVYGGLLLSKVSQMIGMHLPGLNSVWAEVRFRFSSPLYIGQLAELNATVDHVSEATRSVKLRLVIAFASEEIARGTVGVAMRETVAEVRDA